MNALPVVAPPARPLVSLRDLRVEIGGAPILRGVTAASIFPTSQSQPLSESSSPTGTGTPPPTAAAASKLGQAGAR